MIAPATGIKRKFYHAFAEFLTASGFGVITYDNSGIGDSLYGKVKDNNASLITWGTEDMTAVLEYLKVEFPEANYHLLGHSAGGQLAGLMPNCDDFKSLIFIACSSGSLRNMKFPFLLKAHFFMSVFIPITNAILKYSPVNWMNMGEPLPKNVARQWSEWCKGSGYVKMAFGKEVQRHYYDKITCHSLWIYASDDPIAVEKNVQEMIDVYVNLNKTIRKIYPQEFDLSRLGHMGFFSRKNKSVWKIITNYIEMHL